MDTKEKKRERTAPRSSGEERRRRPSPEEADRRKERPRKPAESQPVRKRQNPASRQRPEAEEPRRSPRQRSAERQPAQPAARKRPEEQVYRPAASQQRVRQEPGIRFSAPQGTGLRKSAPKMSSQEAAALRKQQQMQRPPRKKSTLQHFISGTQEQSADAMDPVAKAEQRRKQRAAREEKRRRTAQRYDTPAVIYTQPQAFNRDRLLLQLLTVTAVVAALILGMSVFFKVKNITVAGATTYSTQAVQDASGIQVGDNLLTFSKASASAKIRAKLSYVDKIRIGIKLPDTVIIYIEELDVAYAVQSAQGDWWLINSEGRVVDQIDSKKSGNYTQVTGVQLDNPQIGSQAVAVDFMMQDVTTGEENQAAEATVATAAPVPTVVTGAQRLASALQILKALEANDIVGEAASVDVSDLESITLWYGSRYEVLLGDTGRMDFKIACMNDAILQMSEYQSGILDISFTTWTDQVGYTPFG